MCLLNPAVINALERFDLGYVLGPDAVEQELCPIQANDTVLGGLVEVLATRVTDQVNGIELVQDELVYRFLQCSLDFPGAQYAALTQESVHA